MANARLKLARVQSRKRRRSDAESQDESSAEVPTQSARENSPNCGQEEPETPTSLEPNGLEAALLARKIALETRLSELSLGKSLPRLDEQGYDANGVKLQRTQRDFLLQEMEWMAADFAQERKWRLKTARTLSLSVQSHHTKMASRTARQEKQEEEARRRVAARVGREVKKFWTKIDKIISFKVKLQSDELRKAAMDRHLKSLVAQTERYASALAVAFCEPVESSVGEPENEQQVGEEKEASSIVDAGEPRKTGDPDESDSDFEHGEEEDEDDETTIAEEEKQHTTSHDEQQDELTTLQMESEMSLDELRAKYALVDGAASDQDEATNESVTQGASDDSDFAMGSADEMEDDEETLDAEEKLVTQEDVEDEVARLQEESELSIDELRARYAAALSHEKDAEGAETTENGHRPTDGDDEGDYRPSDDGDDMDDETTLEIAERDEFTAAEVDEEVALLHQESELSIEELRAKYAEIESDGNDASDGEAQDEDSDFKESSTDEEDDETTIAQEEIAEPRSKAQVDDEIANLDAEANLSIEELRARYYGDADENDGSDVDDDHDNEVVDVTDKEERAESTVDHASDYGYEASSYRRPYLLTSRLELREYQQAGVNWLTSMCEKRINGILADEMGLGKTIQTITMLAHLACVRSVWGPHLIVVPTSCMVNWEMEFKRWCPAFKVLTYFGSAKRRKELRHGWSKQNAFQVCITSYQLVVQDAHCFKRKKWYYLILDEAHNIKNWKSLRWQTLLHFNSQRRLLLTGTPLQNNIMELWSLMHFLMPHVFASRKEFTYWFQNPLSVMVEESTGKGSATGTSDAGNAGVLADEQQQLVSQLHGIIRPFVLRRLKKDVAKQLPGKFEHVVTCSLSKRQRFLYEDFISRSSTRRALFGSSRRGAGGSGNFMSMMNVLMQLRKVCNHPDLFEPRPIESPLDMEQLTFPLPARCGYLFDWLESKPCTWWPTSQNLPNQELDAVEKWTTKRKRALLHVYDDVSMSESLPSECSLTAQQSAESRRDVLKRLLKLAEARRAYWVEKRQEQSSSARVRIHIHEPMLGADLIRVATMPVFISHAMEVHTKRARDSGSLLTLSDALCDMVRDPEDRIESMAPVVQKAVCVVPKARARPLRIEFGGRGFSADASDRLKLSRRQRLDDFVQTHLKPVATRCVTAYYEAFKRTQLFFPDKRLIQFDCGKLQQLDILLRELKRGNHRCLIFTQMSSMLNILEIFLNLHGYTYFRLDGSTKVETRQYLMEKFNHDDKIFCFILSTRSGGLGINLTGADSVIFYDSDWNPAMDAQAQDRAHRIGQTRDVHIYRLVSEHTVEENILKKAQQKRHLDFLVMAKGEFTTEFFSKSSLRELMGDLNNDENGGERPRVEIVSDDDEDDEDAAEEEDELSLDAIENAMAQLEDEDDIVAMRGAREEYLTEQREFEEDASTGGGSTTKAAPAANTNRRVSNAGAEASRASSPSNDGGHDEEGKDTESIDGGTTVEESSAAAIADVVENGNTRDATLETDDAPSVDDDVSMLDNEGEEEESAGASDDDQNDGVSLISDDSSEDEDDMSDDDEPKRRGKKPLASASGRKRSRSSAASRSTETAKNKRQKTDADVALANAAHAKRKLERAREKAREMEDERKLQAWKDSVSSLQHFEDSLNAVDRYAMHFREDIDPLFAYVPTAEAYGRLEDETKVLVSIEEIEARKMLEEQQWIAEGELIAGITGIDELLPADVEIHYQLYKKERANVHAARRARQLTGESWELRTCAITGQPFYYNSDTREATWDKPSVLLKNEQCASARELGFAGLPLNVLLLIFQKLHAYPDRLNGVQLVCRHWRDASVHPSLSLRVNSSDFFHAHGDRDHWNELLANIKKGETLLFGSGVYELHEVVEIATPIRLVAAQDAHVELQMATPHAQLRWTARGGVLCGFHVSRRHGSSLASNTTASHWQHLLHVTQGGRVRAAFNDFDGNHQGNACVAVSGDPRSLLVLQQNRIFHAGSGSGVLVVQGALVLQRNSVFANAHSGVTVWSGHAVLRRNHIYGNARFGIRLLYHANHVVVEENRVEHHACGNLDVENSGRRFVVRWNEMQKDDVDDLPHTHHGRVKLLTSRLEERVVKATVVTTKKPPPTVQRAPQDGGVARHVAVPAVVGTALPSASVAVLSKALAVAFAPPLLSNGGAMVMGQVPAASSMTTKPSSTAMPSVAHVPHTATTSVTTPNSIVSLSNGATMTVPVAAAAMPRASTTVATGATMNVVASIQSAATPVRVAVMIDPCLETSVAVPTATQMSATGAATEKAAAAHAPPSVADATFAPSAGEGALAPAAVALPSTNAPGVKVRRKRKPKTEKVLVHGVEMVLHDTCEKKSEKKVVKKPRRADNGDGDDGKEIKLEKSKTVEASVPVRAAPTVEVTPTTSAASRMDTAADVAST